MNNLNITCININGLNDSNKQEKLRIWHEQNKSELLILIDTRLSSNADRLANKLLSTCHYATPSHGSPGGISFLSFSPNLPFHHVRGTDPRVAAIQILINDSPTWIVAVYAPSSPTLRKIFFSHNLKQFLSTLPPNDDLILCGDFNFVENPPVDRTPPPTSSIPPEEPGWSEFIDAVAPCHLKDCFRLLHPNDRAFTYLSHAHKSSSRIDRMYISPGHLTSLRSFFHTHIWKDLSDHPFGCTITLSPPSHPKRKNNQGPWRLNTSYLGQPALTRDIANICSFYTSASNRQTQWWDSFKNDMRKACQAHSRAESARVKGQIRALQTKVAALSTRLLEQPSHHQTILDLSHAEHQLSSYLNTKLSFIRNCAAMKSNPHALNALQALANKVKARKAKTFIPSLTHEGSTYTSHNAIHLHASSFYSNLYNHSSDGHPDHPIWRTHQTTIPPEVSNMLSSPISLKALGKALHSLPNNKTPGADGLPKEFYKAYWPLIGPLFLIMAKEFEKGLLPNSMTQAITVLIFKKGNHQNIANYRPISLLGTDYKILAKLLSQRLTHALPLIIHDDQSGFVKGRSIQDSLFTALDTLDFCNATSKPGYLFLLDLKKAYDTLDRLFLFKSLTHLGLPPHFTTLVRTLHINTSTRLNINNSLGPCIPILSGVRQGCPIAPQLFICAVEMLTRLAKSQLRPFYPTPSSPKLLSCYADDITFYGENELALKEILTCIDTFSLVSNEHPNLDKCAILPMGSARLAPPLSLNNIPFVTSSDSERILGIFLSPSESTKSTWSGIIQGISKKLIKWKSLYPTSQARATIVNNFIIPKFSFQARFHPPPVEDWKKLKTLLFNFVSGNVAHATHTAFRIWSTKTICTPAKNGGLGVTHPDVTLTALSVQRMLYIFKRHHPAANYSRTLLTLPFGLRTFVCHKDILKSSLPLSHRWRADLTNILSSNIAPHEPPLHPFALATELLAFNPFILKKRNTSFGNDPNESFLLLEKTTLGDLLTSDKPLSWRFMCIQELRKHFPASHIPTLQKIIKAIPERWKVTLHSPNFTSFFQTHPYVLHLSSNDPTIYQVTKYYANHGFAFCTPCTYIESKRSISTSHAPGISISIAKAMPILMLNSEPIAPIISPESLILRYPSLTQHPPVRFGKIIHLLTPHPQLPFQEKWNRILPNINWANTFKFRRASFIPPKEKDILLRIQCNTLPTAARLHSKNIPIVCDHCDEGMILPNPIHNPTPSTPPSPPPPAPEKIETLQHLLFTCPTSQFIRSSLLRTLEFH